MCEPWSSPASAAWPRFEVFAGKRAVNSTSSGASARTSITWRTGPSRSTAGSSSGPCVSVFFHRRMRIEPPRCQLRSVPVRLFHRVARGACLSGWARASSARGRAWAAALLAATLLLGGVGNVVGQEALNLSLAGEQAAHQRRLARELQPYSLKLGDAEVRWGASLAAEWN